MRIRASACTACGADHLNATQVADAGDTSPPARPSPGDVTICAFCGHVMVFGERLRLRDPTPEESERIARDPVVARFLAGLGQARRPS